MEEKPTTKILLAIDKEDSFDYQKGLSIKYTLKDHLDMICEEVDSFQQIHQYIDVQVTKASTNETVLVTNPSLNPKAHDLFVITP